MTSVLRTWYQLLSPSFLLTYLDLWEYINISKHATLKSSKIDKENIHPANSEMLCYMSHISCFYYYYYYYFHYYVLLLLFYFSQIFCTNEMRCVLTQCTGHEDELSNLRSGLGSLITSLINGADETKRVACPRRMVPSLIDIYISRPMLLSM